MLKLRAYPLAQRLIDYTEISIRKLVRLCKRSIHLFNSLAEFQWSTNRIRGRHSQPEILVSQLSYEAALIISMGWRIAITDLYFRDRLIHLNHPLAQFKYQKFSRDGIPAILFETYLA